jgi:tetratricopeptide (TPR) repeat protein
MRDWPAATNHLLQAKELTRSANGIVLVSLAAACQSAGDSRQAAAAARLAEEAASNSWEVFDRLGVFYYKAEPRDRDLNRARASLERAVRLAPKSPLAHRHLGDILLLQHAPDAALKEFERSLALRRTPQTLSSIGSAYLSTRRFAAAADYFSQASQADPSKYLYHVNAGMALRELLDRLRDSRAQFTQALRQTQDTLSSGGERALVRAYQGLCHAGLEESAEARQDLEQALTEGGRDMHVLRVVIDGFRLLGDSKRAREVDQLIRETVD